MHIAEYCQIGSQIRVYFGEILETKQNTIILFSAINIYFFVIN